MPKAGELSNIAYNTQMKHFGVILWENEPYESHLPATFKIGGKGIWAKDNTVKRLTVEQSKKLLRYQEKLEGIENPWVDATDRCIKFIGGLEDEEAVISPKV